MLFRSKTPIKSPTTVPASASPKSTQQEIKTVEPVVPEANEVVPEKPKKSEPTQEPKKVVPPKKKIDVGKKNVRGIKKQPKKVKKTNEQIQEQKRLAAIQMASVPEEIIQRQKEIVFGEDLSNEFNTPLANWDSLKLDPNSAIFDPRDRKSTRLNSSH